MSVARLLATVGVLLTGTLGAPAPADVVTLSNGKSLRGTVFREPTRVKVNPYGSTLSEMTFGVVEVAVSHVKGTAAEDSPTEVYRALDALAPGDAEARKALLARAVALKQKDLERRIQQEISAAAGPSAWKRETRRLLYVEAAQDRKAGYERLVRDAGIAVPPAAIERMARSLHEERGEVHESTGSRYVPYDVDPLVPRPLLLALHGGGPVGGKGAAVMGTGREALSLFLDGARKAGFIVLAPTAVEWPWTSPANEARLRTLLDDAVVRWNVDLDRIVVAGQGGGGVGALALAGRLGDRLATAAAVASDPTAAVGVASRGIAVWIYHGEKDEVFPVEASRKVAERLRAAGEDFVYCEVPGLGHGFPARAEADFWHFASPRRRSKAKTAGPTASFEQPVGEAEVARFGDPLASWGIERRAEPAEWIASLRSGRSDAEAAAVRLAFGGGEEAVREAVAILKDRSLPVAARVHAAWLLGKLRDASALEPLGDVVRAESDPWLVASAARALRALGSPDALEDLRSALRDAGDRYQRRSFPGRKVPWFEFDRACRLLADLVESVASVASVASGAKAADDLPAEIEAAAVLKVLRDPRPVDARASSGEDASEPRSRLAEACARAYRAQGAEKTLFDMLASVLKGDAKALQAAAKGASEALPR